MPAIIIIVLGLGLIGFVIYYSYQMKLKRREELATLAAKWGMQYSAADPFAIDVMMPHRLFSMGDGRGCENVVWGVWQTMPATVFDYWYYDESTDSDGTRSRSYHRFSCMLTQIPARCPSLVISGENLFTRMADSLGFRDIEFETEEFNRAWQIKGPDRKFANDLIDQRMMAWLMHAGNNWSFELEDSIVLVHSGKMKPAELTHLLECGKAFVSKIPKIIWDLYPGSGGVVPGAPTT